MNSGQLAAHLHRGTSTISELNRKKGKAHKLSTKLKGGPPNPLPIIKW